MTIWSPGNKWWYHCFPLLSLLLYVTVLEYIYMCLVYALFTSNDICYLRRETLLNVLLNHRNPSTYKFALSGLYKLTCLDCNKAYVGQTGRHFSIRYKEHESVFHNNSHTSNFSQHFHEEAHSFGTINNIMQELHHQRKRGTYKHVWEVLHPQGTRSRKIWMTTKPTFSTKSLTPSSRTKNLTP